MVIAPKSEGHFVACLGDSDIMAAIIWIEKIWLLKPKKSSEKGSRYSYGGIK